MKTLEKGWDSYKADPPTLESIELARAFLELKPHPRRCVPTAMGGAALSYKRGRREASIEFYNKASCKIAVLLSDGVAMNVVKSDTLEPILEAVNNYLVEPPILARDEIDAVDADLDMLIAKHVFDFPGLGYYRRKSAHDNTEPMYELCGRADCCPDMPTWGSSAYYMYMGHLRSVNCFSSDHNEAFRVVQMMLYAARKYSDRFILNLIGNTSTVASTDAVTFVSSILKDLNPKKIAMAALYAIAEISPTDENGD